MNFLAGHLLDHYRIESLVARSGMASVFRATDTRNDQQGGDQDSARGNGE